GALGEATRRRIRFRSVRKPLWRGGLASAKGRMSSRYMRVALRISYLIMIKTIYFCLVSLALLLWPTKDGADMRYSKRQVWTANGLSFESNFSSWDAEQYLFLSEGGYHAGLGQCAFYPLYPMLVRWVSAVTRSDDILVALVLANAFPTVGLILFFEIAAARFGEGEACLATALLLAFPGSLFFQFIYTEALFLLLLMVFCLGL